ncbi:MAG: hypothetical protein AB8I08_28475 [Sandaracinaceae bacterium]
MLRTPDLDFGDLGPTQLMFADFEGGDVGAEITAANSGIGVDANGTAARFHDVARSGSHSANFFQGGFGRQYSLHFDDTTEFFASFATQVPPGTDFPRGGGPNQGDYAGSSWKMAWLTRDGDFGQTTDIVLVSHTGNGCWRVAGNATTERLNLGCDPSWYRWNEWIRTTVWLRADSDAPDQGAGNNYFNALNTVDPMTVIENDWRTFSPNAQGTGPFHWNQINLMGWSELCPGNGGACSNNVELLYDDVYMAWGPGAAARVELCDAESYVECTDAAIFTIDAWGRNEVEATVHMGAFDDAKGLFVHIFNADNELVGTAVVD